MQSVKLGSLTASLVISLLSTFLDFSLIFSVQVTERMKIVDVLGAKQFSDGERIITQV